MRLDSIMQMISLWKVDGVEFGETTRQMGIVDIVQYGKMNAPIYSWLLWNQQYIEFCIAFSYNIYNMLLFEWNVFHWHRNGYVIMDYCSILAVSDVTG